MTAFALDPRIETTSLPVGRFPLCAVRLVNDKRFPWLLLVPERAGLTEIHELEPALRDRLGAEVAAASRALRDATGAHKMNVGALGNLVPQLHIHVIARFRDDAAWPGPVWGAGAAMPYAQTEADHFMTQLRTCFEASDFAAKQT